MVMNREVKRLSHSGDSLSRSRGLLASQKNFKLKTSVHPRISLLSYNKFFNQRSFCQL